MSPTQCLVDYTPRFLRRSEHGAGGYDRPLPGCLVMSIYPGENLLHCQGDLNTTMFCQQLGEGGIVGQAPTTVP
jgi:hypothetical protein